MKHSSNISFESSGKSSVFQRLYEVIEKGCGAAGSLLAMQWPTGIRKKQFSGDSVGAPESSLASRAP